MQAASPLTWPNFFGVLAQKNTSNPANFDLSVVYNPAGGAAGMSAPPVLETFTDLSLVPGDPNYVLPKINAVSRFITIPAAPPGAVPAGYPAAPDMLIAGGTTDLKDTGGTTYLTVQPTNPASWPPLFGVLTQGDLTDPLKFNLLVVYAPSEWQRSAGSRGRGRVRLDYRSRLVTHPRLEPGEASGASKTSRT